MAPITHRSRIHLLAAKETPTIVILQRKRAKLFHVVTLDTQTHRITEGSWFRGVIYALHCDVAIILVHKSPTLNPTCWLH